MSISACFSIRLAAVSSILIGTAAVSQVPGIEAYRTNSPPGQDSLYQPFMTRPLYEAPVPGGTVLARARAEIDAGNFRQAQRVLERGVRNWYSAEPRYLAAVAHSGLGDLDEARRAFAGALTVDENHVGASVGLALTDIRLGRHEEAAAALTELEARRDACAGRCNNAAVLDRGVQLIRHALEQPQPPLIG